MLWFHPWAHITHCFRCSFFDTLGTDLVCSFWVVVARAGLCLLASWEYVKASFPLVPCSKYTELVSSTRRRCMLSCESSPVREKRNVHLHVGMLRGLGVLVWLCVTYFCPWSTGAYYWTWHNWPLHAYLSTFASFDHSFLSPPVSLGLLSFCLLCLTLPRWLCSLVFWFFLCLPSTKYSKHSVCGSKLCSLSFPPCFQWRDQWFHRAPNQPSWKAPGHYRPLLPNIQLVFDESLPVQHLPPSPSHSFYARPSVF